MSKEMTREKIEDIIKWGTTRDKAKLFLRDRMGYFKCGIDFILNFGEPEIISDSIPPQDQSEWNYFLSWGLRIENGFKDLIRFYDIVINKISELSTLLSQVSDIETIEEATNEAIILTSSQIKLLNKEGEQDIKRIQYLRTEFLRLALDNRHFNKLSPVVMDEGVLSLNCSLTETEKGLSDEDSVRLKHRNKLLSNYLDTEIHSDLRDRVVQAYKELRLSVRRYLIFELALKRRIDELKLSLPEYGHLIKYHTQRINRLLPLSLRYEGFSPDSLSLFDEESNQDNSIPFPAMRDLIQDYSYKTTDVNLNEGDVKITFERYYKSI